MPFPIPFLTYPNYQIEIKGFEWKEWIRQDMIFKRWKGEWALILLSCSISATSPSDVSLHQTPFLSFLCHSIPKTRHDGRDAKAWQGWDKEWRRVGRMKLFFLGTHLSVLHQSISPSSFLSLWDPWQTHTLLGPSCKGWQVGWAPVEGRVQNFDFGSEVPRVRQRSKPESVIPCVPRSKLLWS